MDVALLFLIYVIVAILIFGIGWTVDDYRHRNDLDDDMIFVLVCTFFWPVVFPFVIPVLGAVYLTRRITKSIIKRITKTDF